MAHSGRSAQVPILREELQGSNSKGSSGSPSWGASFSAPLGSIRLAYKIRGHPLLYRAPTGSLQWGLQHLHMVSLLSLQDAYRALTGSYRIPSGSLVDPHMVTRGSSQDPYSTTAVSLLDLDRIPTGSQ